MNTPKRLYRSTQERMFAGVCGGIAEYLEVDPTLVRLVFVALTLLGGPGLVIYIVLMLIVPEKPQEEWQAKAKHTEPTSLVKSSVPVPDTDTETDSPSNEPEA